MKLVFLAVDGKIEYEELVLIMHDEFVVSLHPPLLQPRNNLMINMNSNLTHELLFREMTLKSDLMVN